MPKEVKKQLKELWQAGRDRRKFAELLFYMFEGRWRDQAQLELESRFSKETYEHLRMVTDTSLNPARFITDKVAAIYTRPTSRTVNGEEIPEYDSMGKTDLTFDQACKLNYMMREAFVRPMVTEHGLMFDLIPAHCVEVVQSYDNPLKIEAIMYEVDGDFVVWTDEEHHVYHDRGMHNEMQIEGNESNENPYGVIPIVPVHHQWPCAGGFWHTYSAMPLHRASIETAVSLTNFRHLQKMSSHKQPYLVGKPGKSFNSNMILDPAYPFVLDNGGSAGILDMQADLNEKLGVILDSIGAVANQEGVRPEVVRSGTGIDASSGYALKLKLTDLSRRWEEQRRLWDVWENMIYQVARRVVEVDGPQYGFPQLPEGQLKVEWADIGPAQDPKELTELWSARISAGIGSRVDAIMAIDNVGEDEAREKVAEIDLDRTGRVGNEIFGMASPIPMVEESPLDTDVPGASPFYDEDVK